MSHASRVTMTIRDDLGKQFRAGRIACRVFLFIAVLGGITAVATGDASVDSDASFVFLFLPAQFLVCSGILGAVFFACFTPFRVRCPKCRSGFGWFQRLRIPDNMKYCPFCGVDVDAET